MTVKNTVTAPKALSVWRSLPLASGPVLLVGLLLLLRIVSPARITVAAEAATEARAKPRMEDYATVESVCNGVPVYSFSNLVYVYGVSPDIVPKSVVQEGNTRPRVKLRPKKSWEIKRSLFGAEHEFTPRTALNDSQPMLPIHLIDGDRDTVWTSWGSMVPDGRPEWIRIDLPVEAEVSSVALVCGVKSPCSWVPYGKSLPKEVEVKLSKDAWHWETVYNSKDFAGDPSGISVIKFTSRRAKQVWITANRFPVKLWWLGHCFSIGEVEVRDPAGNNLALVSRGAGVTVSSTSYGVLQDRFTQDALWAPLQYDLGVKWVRLNVDNGPGMWCFAEHEEGRLEVDRRFEESVTEVARNGIDVIMGIDFKGNWIYQNPPRKTDWKKARYSEVNDLYSDYPGHCYSSPEMMEGYLRYVDFMVRRFQDKVAYFEIGNEWNNWMGVEEYITKVFEPTYRAIKRAAPHAKIILGSTGGGGNLNGTQYLAVNCLGPGSGVRGGKFEASGRTIAAIEGRELKDAKVSVEAKSQAQVGIVLRCNDSPGPGGYYNCRFLAATYDPERRSIFFQEVTDYDVSRLMKPLDVVPAKDLGEQVRLIAEVKGSAAMLTVSDGLKTYTAKHTITSKALNCGSVGLIHCPIRPLSLLTAGQFDNFQVAYGDGRVVFEDGFNGPEGRAQGWKMVLMNHWREPQRRLAASMIDAIGWHTCGSDRAYIDEVRNVKKDCRSLGFTGDYLGTELYPETAYPPGPPAVPSELQQAKLLAQLLLVHSGLDMRSGPCHPHFTGYPQPVNLCRWTWPNQAINTTQPSMAYYAYRTLATAMDDFRAADFPVVFQGRDDLISMTFRCGDHELMVGVFIPGVSDGVVEAKTTMVLPAVKAKKAWGVDLMNGTEQELAVRVADDKTIIPDIVIKDCPLLVRIEK